MYIHNHPLQQMIGYAKLPFTHASNFIPLSSCSVLRYSRDLRSAFLAAEQISAGANYTTVSRNFFKQQLKEEVSV